MRDFSRAIITLACVATLTSSVPANERESKSAADWAMFRGGPQLRGIASEPLAQALRVRWTFAIDEPITSTAAIVDKRVYVGGHDGYLYALDLGDGSLIWKYDAGEPIQSSPTVFNGAVFFGDDVGTFHAVDAASGKKKWTFETESQIIASANVNGERLVVGSYDGNLYCLSQTGEFVWKYSTEDRLHGTPGVADGTALCAGCDGLLHVVSLADGKAVRKISLGSVSGASAATLGGRAYIGTYDGTLVAVDYESGKPDWIFRDDEREFPILSSVALTPDTVYFGGRDKRVRSLDRKSGQQRWSFVTQGRIDSSPVLVGDRLFIGSSDGNLYALDAATGNLRWKYEAGAISASPAVAHGHLVIGTEDGVLYAFGAK